MFNKKTGIFIFAVTASLIGLLWLQYYWISYSFQQKSEAFDSRMNSILMEAVTEIEESFYCIDFFSEFTISPGQGVYLMKHNWEGNEFIPIDKSSQADTIPMYFWNQFGYDTLLSYSNVKFNYPANIRMELNVEYLQEENPDFLKNDGNINSYRQSVANNVDFLNTVDSVLRKKIIAQGFDLAYQYQIKDKTTNKILISNPETLKAKSIESNIEAILFNGNYFFSPLQLSLIFPGKQKNLIKELWLVVFVSILLIALLASLVMYFVRAMVQQQRLSEMKSDFISNMTHEFKTPVANINLAIETMEKQGLVENEKAQLYTGIIREENRRLRNNIDLILETSLFENKKLKLTTSQIDVHELLVGIIETIQLDLNEKNGKITNDFQAGEFIIYADETHLSNVFLNLLDN
ncbi:MAG: hypothetical protein DRJ05_18480, partial [Bacteroidetes bacterium]